MFYTNKVLEYNVAWGHVGKQRNHALYKLSGHSSISVSSAIRSIPSALAKKKPTISNSFDTLIKEATDTKKNLQCQTRRIPAETKAAVHPPQDQALNLLSSPYAGPHSIDQITHLAKILHGAQESTPITRATRVVLQTRNARD